MNRRDSIFFVTIKNFITGDNVFVSPELGEVSANRKLVDLEFLINAPMDYQSDEAEVILFIDKHNCERSLSKGKYQVRHHEISDNSRFIAWANRFIRTLHRANAPSLLLLDFNQLIEMLVISNRKRFEFKTFASTEIQSLDFTQLDVACSPIISTYITSEQNININDFRAMLKKTSSKVSDKAMSAVSFVESHKVQGTEVSVFYALAEN